MRKSLIDQLPPELAKLVHPDRRKNEQDYWAVRDQLLAQYRGMWIGFADGTVVASGTSPVDVMHEAEATGRHPYFGCVGYEDEPCRVRRASYRYDTEYRGQALPIIDVEFRGKSGELGASLDRVIPDTGADATVLPWSDFEAIGADPTSAIPARLSGVGGASTPTLSFQAWALLDGGEYPCRLYVDTNGTDRILGRDVMNRLEILFRGPDGEVVINP